VIIDQDAIRSQVKVTDAEVKDYYAQHLDDYHVPDRVKVARILFKTTGKTPQEIAAIEKTAEGVLAQLKAGKDFGELAGKYSEDPSAAQGGVVGWIRHGQAVKAFEDAAFSLQPGQISGLIHAEYGLDIIKVLDKQTAHVETFDEVKDQIRAQLEKQKVAQAQSQFANDLDQQLKSNPQQFAAIAAKAGLQAKESPLFQYKQVVPDFGNSESFADLAFQLRPGEVGQPFAVPKGTAIIQLMKSIPEHVPPLEDVRPKVEADYRVAEAPEVASKKAEQFAAQAKKGDFQAVARSMGLAVSESKDFTERSSDFIPGVGSGSDLADAFTLATGQTSGVVKAGNNLVVFQVLSHTPADEADFAAQKDQIAEQLVEQKRELAFELYEQNLKQQMMRSGKLKINEAAMKQFLASYQHS
jgi:peptidyl-prolyl cis-trans isomerase D